MRMPKIKIRREWQKPCVNIARVDRVLHRQIRKAKKLKADYEKLQRQLDRVRERLKKCR